MNNIVFWKSFFLGDLFERSTKLSLNSNQKDLNLSDQKDDNHSVALISASREGSGRAGYLSDNDYNLENVSINKITFDDQWGYTYCQQEEFIITGGHNSILEVKNNALQQITNKNVFTLVFISNIINKITIKTNIYGYGYKINNKFDREIIMLPLLETEDDELTIYKNDNKKYTLAVDYIKCLMDKAQIIKDNNTVVKFENEKVQIETERLLYQLGYNSTREKILWVAFKIEQLFRESTEHYLEKSKKNYNISEEKTDEYCIAVCAASKNNNGIVGYINEVDDVPIKKRKGFLTKGGFGHVFYQDDWFIKPGGSWGMLNILKCVNGNLKNILDKNVLLYKWLAKIMTKMFTDLTSWGQSIDISREIIMLPLLETEDDELTIYKNDNKKYTLAVDYMSYLYLTSCINNLDKKISNYRR